MARTSSSMDSLRESVGLRGYGQKDLLIEYKNEGYDMLRDDDQYETNGLFNVYVST